MTGADVTAFMRLFPELRDASWDKWRAVLGRLTEATREFWLIKGRGAGGSRIGAMLLTYFASQRYRRALGESIYCGIFAPDRRQATVTFRYVHGMLRAVPELADLIVATNKSSIELSNGVVIEVLTASTAAPRGRSYALAVVEEAAFLPSDDSANPDVELLRALRPALARVPGSLLCVISSPYARKGILWTAWQRYGSDGADPTVLLVKAGTLELNPTFDATAIDKATADDPASARSEYGAEFRTDVEQFLPLEAIAAVTVEGRLELPYLASRTYVGFFDPAGGSGQDSFTLAISHHEHGCAVLDLVREARPPFSPEAVVAEFADVLKAYRLSTATSDRWGGDWPTEAFRKSGITVRPAERTRSEIYQALLPAVMSGQVELLDHARLLKQLASLERRTGRQGRNSIDSPPRMHEDIANSAAGALVEVSRDAHNHGPIVLMKLTGY